MQVAAAEVVDMPEVVVVQLIQVHVKAQFCKQALVQHTLAVVVAVEMAPVELVALEF